MIDILVSVALHFGLANILFSLGIWISYFDNDGGEPGATTIFASITLWPLFGLLIVAVGIACGFSRRVFSSYS